VIIADLIIAIGTTAFILAGIRQLRKILYTHKTDGLSATQYKIKVFALMCMINAYIISNLPYAIMTNIIDLIIVILILYHIAKYRNISMWRV
jgi:uncharacterized protein with PQ loop repeat